MTSIVRPFITRSSLFLTSTRSYHYTFKRVHTPPLQKPKESPYIVGPYLKPGYYPVEYYTDPIKPKHDDDLDHFIYEPTKVEYDHERTVQLLLLQDVEGLGVAGQVVDVNYRFGASKLVAMKKAEYATDFALKWHKFGPKTFESASSALSPRTARLLKSRTFDLPVSRSVVVQPWHLSMALRFVDCICPIEAIDKDSITEYKDEDENTQVKCIVRINNHEKVEVKFKFINVKKE